MILLPTYFLGMAIHVRLFFRKNFSAQKKAFPGNQLIVIWSKSWRAIWRDFPVTVLLSEGSSSAMQEGLERPHADPTLSRLLRRSAHDRLPRNVLPSFCFYLLTHFAYEHYGGG